MAERTPVPELLDLKFQNVSLRMQVAEGQMTQIQQAYRLLQGEKDQIVAEMRQVAGAGPTDAYDARTRMFTEAPTGQVAGSNGGPQRPSKPPLSVPPVKQAKRAARLQTLQ